ncbi:CobW family GTP-binding protein [Sulfitobacter sp. MF3-043]|uniref:CobW family GTP-binding protein n=1 Tax=Sulfitobacter sediminivivens TaxID=3252902 RepID=UPI0036DAEECD
MTPLPLTVISGYLGAGKTTLINRLLTEDHRLKFLIMVNDFGAVNIDKALISVQDKDVIALTNGCVCCTMGADLFMALGDALDRRPRPDHVIIEASGIADPLAIANTAIAEPELRYAGIITLVDADNITELLNDPLIAPQVQGQIRAGDVVLLTKSEHKHPAVTHLFAGLGLPEPATLGDWPISGLLSGLVPKTRLRPSETHGAYTTWHHETDVVLDHDALVHSLKNRPRHLFRLKGFAQTSLGNFEVHVVGKNMEIRRLDTPHKTILVGLGLAALISLPEIQEWWDR